MDAAKKKARQFAYGKKVAKRKPKRKKAPRKRCRVVTDPALKVQAPVGTSYTVKDGKEVPLTAAPRIVRSAGASPLDMIGGL